jgi:biopolymer transport protein ExbD
MPQSELHLQRAPGLPPRRDPPRPIRTRFYTPKDNFAPIATINTTPLVDVMLVLIIMFILIIPVASHKVALDLPGAPPPVPGPPPPTHRLDIAANGALLWDGAATAPAALPARLAALAADPQDPVLQLNADGAARYEQVDRILGQIRTAGVTRMGFVNNHDFAEAF